jgi:hypothetical protein
MSTPDPIAAFKSIPGYSDPKNAADPVFEVHQTFLDTAYTLINTMPDSASRVDAISTLSIARSQAIRAADRAARDSARRAAIRAEQSQEARP